MSDRDTETVDGPLELSPAPSLQAGTIVNGRYEIRRFLGLGGSAYVYEAFDKDLQQPIALKMLRADRLTKNAGKRLRREVAIARRAADDRLIRVFDVGESPWGMYLTMELFDAPNLASFMRGRKLPIEKIIDICAQIVEAIGALHALGIVHRDIKPSNVLIDESGHIKVADFGLALHLEGDESRLTQSAAILGTLEYVSPEQALGGEIDGRSDLYSFGVLVFELVTGRLPFQSKSSLGAVVAHLHHRAPAARSLRQDTPRWLSRLLGVLLEKDPESRMASAADVAAVFRRRRMPLTMALRWKRAAVMMAVLFSLVAAALLVRYARSFARLEQDGKGTLSGINRMGGRLWSIGGVRPECCVAVLRESGRPKYVAVVRDMGGNSDPAPAHELLLFDIADGHAIRSVGLPSGASFFPSFAANFHLGSLAPADLYGDGNDVVVASYVHSVYWPSYTDVYDPRSQIGSVVFLGSGHHRFATAVDVNGDGRKDLILVGINNRMGWYSAATAIDINTTTNFGAFPHFYSGRSPDADLNPESSRSILWYALLPVGHPTRVRPVDVLTRRIVIDYDDGHTERVAFDGFRTSLPGVGSSVRNGYRNEAYDNLREADRLLSGGFPSESIACADRARAAAIRSSDPSLVEWVKRRHATILVAIGRKEDAMAEFDQTRRDSPMPSEVAFDAGRAFHIHGHLEDAANWYHRGLGLGTTQQKGRGLYEFVEGEVLALGELGRWEEARRAIRRFRDQYPHQKPFADAFWQYVQWRNGETIELPVSINDGSPDEIRYWSLEFLRAKGRDPSAMLHDIAVQKQLSSDQTLLQSLEAEVKADLGNRAEAYAISKSAFETARQSRDNDVLIRAHYDLVALRFVRLAHSTGHPGEARAAERDIARAPKPPSR